MPVNKKRFVAYGLVALLSVALIAQTLISKENSSFVQTSLFNVYKPVPADLALEKVTINKIANPGKDFNYYKYSVNAVIRNNGGALKNAKVVLHAGDEQAYIFVKNSAEGFSLEEGNSYIFEKYEIVFDADFNAGKLEFKLELKDQEDVFEDNNSYELEFFELPAKIGGVGLEKIEGGVYHLAFDPLPYEFNAEDLEVMVSDGLQVEEDNLKYDEIADAEGVYGYHRLKVSEEILKDAGWRSQGKLEDRKLQFPEGDFGDNVVRYVYLKAESDTGKSLFSNILRVGPQKELDKADFARFFVEFTQEPVDEDGVVYYIDVKDEQWFAPYVKTLFNLGLVNPNSENYYPDRVISRGSVLRILMDYFDVDLALGEGEEFEDPYLRTFYTSKKGQVFDGDLNPDLPATKNYLKYLINEFKKDS